MRVWIAASVLLVLGSACSAGFDDKANSDSDNNDGPGNDGGDGGSGGSGGDGGDGGSGSQYDLPNLTSSLVPLEGCYGYDGIPVTGATAYFYGEYLPDGEGGWTGEERWILFANEAWNDAGVDDCEVVWMTRATAGSTGACGACAVGLSVAASIDVSQTTCPDQLWEDPADQQWATEYGVAVSGSESAWYYAASGTYVGEGGADGEAFNFITEATCQYF